MSINKPRRGSVRIYLLLVIYVGLEKLQGRLLRLYTFYRQTMAETKIIYRPGIEGRRGRGEGRAKGNNNPQHHARVVTKGYIKFAPLSRYSQSVSTSHALMTRLLQNYVRSILDLNKDRRIS